MAGTLAAALQLMPGKKQMVQAAPGTASPAPQDLCSRWLRRSVSSREHHSAYSLVPGRGPGALAQPVTEARVVGLGGQEQGMPQSHPAPQGLA